MLLNFILILPESPPKKLLETRAKCVIFHVRNFHTWIFILTLSIHPKSYEYCEKCVSKKFLHYVFIFSYSYLWYYKWTYNLLCDIRHNENRIRECEKLSWITHMNMSISILHLLILWVSFLSASLNC